MNKRNEILPLIMEGLTIHEIMDKLGYKSDSSIYAVAKENGIKLASTSDKRTEMVKQLRDQGKSAKEIAEHLGVSEAYVYVIAKKCNVRFRDYGTGKSKRVKHFSSKIRTCGICGKEFEANSQNQKYCCIECQRKANRVPKGEVDEARAIEMIANKQPEWEYVGGYTGSEGTMVIRHKACGFTARKSAVTIRHADKLKCMVCDERERIKRERQKQKQKAEKYKQKHFKNIKYKTYSFKECCVCGAFFVPEHSNRTTCSDECCKAKINHYYSMKKEHRRKKAWTSESNSINVRSVYEKDNGICWLCGEPCDIEADPNDNMYPSVDHVIPIARGGKDEWSNVRLAHRLCNSIKWVHIIEDPNASLCSPGSN